MTIKTLEYIHCRLKEDVESMDQRRRILRIKLGDLEDYGTSDKEKLKELREMHEKLTQELRKAISALNDFENTDFKEGVRI